MSILYTFFLLLYYLGVWLISPFSGRARSLISGRRGTFRKLKQGIRPGEEWIWFHCASLGEFEQGRPVMEKYREKEPDKKILLSFYSPSGYEIRKNYGGADLVVYLPFDFPWNARRFLRLVGPFAAVFVKYEFWYNYLSGIQRRKIPSYLISAIFRESQPFFRWYGRFFRRRLKGFTRLYVQDEQSAKLLQGINIEQYTVCGDTRFDRVYDISRQSAPLPVLEAFRGNEPLVMAGSSWPAEEEIMAEYVNRHSAGAKWVIAPHEIDAAHVAKLESLFAVPVVRYSLAAEKDLKEFRVMIIDNFGMLSSAYRYAHIAIVGGGFGKGIHNILEPATWGIPVLFGPNYRRFREAHGMLEAGGGLTFSNSKEFGLLMDRLLTDESELQSRSRQSLEYVESNLGATEAILAGLLGR